MEYTTRIGDRPTQAHVNYRCPCGCEAGLLYDRDEGPEHLGRCCCGRLLWVGPQARAVIRSHLNQKIVYDLDMGEVQLPWSEKTQAALAIPATALAKERVAMAEGKTLTKVKDPVCGMMIAPERAAATLEYEGTTYSFCAVSCRDEFEAHPAKYVA